MLLSYVTSYFCSKKIRKTVGIKSSEKPGRACGFGIAREMKSSYSACSLCLKWPSYTGGWGGVNRPEQESALCLGRGGCLTRHTEPYGSANLQKRRSAFALRPPPVVHPFFLLKKQAETIIWEQTSGFTVPTTYHNTGVDCLSVATKSTAKKKLHTEKNLYLIAIHHTKNHIRLWKHDLVVTLLKNWEHAWTYATNVFLTWMPKLAICFVFVTFNEHFFSKLQKHVRLIFWQVKQVSQVNNYLLDASPLPIYFLHHIYSTLYIGYTVYDIYCFTSYIYHIFVYVALQRKAFKYVLF